jgi:hypothetical protein
MIDIERSIDIEDAVRMALADHLTVYCRPLPASYSLPCILVTQVGGSDTNKIDTFEITLDSRAKEEADALEYLRNAVGVLKAVAGSNTPIRHISVNSSGSWGADPVRPDLAMCSARLEVVAHLENVTIN